LAERILGLRETLSANRTYYVRSDGSDSNDGKSDNAAGAWLTLQHADDVLHTIDFAGSTPTVQVRAGTYAGFSSTKPYVGGVPRYLGDTTTPANVVINSAISASNYAALRLAGFKFTGQVGANGATIVIDGKVEFGAGPQFHMLVEGAGGNITIQAPYTISGSPTLAHWGASSSGLLSSVGNAVTLTGTPNFPGAFAYAQLGQMRVHGSSFIGSATGPRFYVDGQTAVIFTQGLGVSALPGNVTPTAPYPNGGQYI
jgi:hypothetical protein